MPASIIRKNKESTPKTTMKRLRTEFLCRITRLFEAGIAVWRVRNTIINWTHNHCAAELFACLFHSFEAGIVKAISSFK